MGFIMIGVKITVWWLTATNWNLQYLSVSVVSVCETLLCPPDCLCCWRVRCQRGTDFSSGCTTDLKDTWRIICPPKNIFSLERVDPTDDIQSCGLILSFTVEGSCLPAGKHKIQGCSLPCLVPVSLLGTFSSPKPQVHRWGDTKSTRGWKASLSLTLHKSQLATECTWI